MNDEHDNALDDKAIKEKLVEKTSAWSDKESPATPEAPQLPPWVMEFEPGSVFWHNGWKCVIRHVGCEEGHWLVLVEPTEHTRTRGMRRAEFRRLVRAVGKKAAKAKMKEAQDAEHPTTA